jgi:hypothetical protein
MDEATRKFLVYLIGPVSCLALAGLTVVALGVGFGLGNPPPPDPGGAAPVLRGLFAAFWLVIGVLAVATGLRGIAERELVISYRWAWSYSLIELTGDAAVALGVVHCFLGAISAGCGLYGLIRLYQVVSVSGLF